MFFAAEARVEFHCAKGEEGDGLKIERASGGRKLRKCAKRYFPLFSWAGSSSPFYMLRTCDYLFIMASTILLATMAVAPSASGGIRLGWKGIIIALPSTSR